jgi:hypothetical protein
VREATVKESKTAGELAGIIREELGGRVLRINVGHDDAVGWSATVYDATNDGGEVQQMVNCIAERLRQIYELKSPR